MTQSVDFVIETSGPGKSFGSDQLLRDVELVFSRHSIFGFLGPKGGGKAMLKKVVLSLIRQTTDRGSIFSLLHVIGGVGLIISHSLFCLTYILEGFFRFEKTEF